MTIFDLNELSIFFISLLSILFRHLQTIPRHLDLSVEYLYVFFFNQICQKKILGTATKLQSSLVNRRSGKIFGMGWHAKKKIKNHTLLLLLFYLNLSFSLAFGLEGWALAHSGPSLDLPLSLVYILFNNFLFFI